MSDLMIEEIYNDLSTVPSIPLDSPRTDIFSDLDSCLRNIDSCDSVDIVEISSDDSFFRHQHEILDGRLLVVDIKGDHLYVSTQLGMVFAVNMTLVSKKFFEVVFTSTYPSKIHCSSVHFLDYVKKNKHHSLLNFSDALSIYFDFPCQSFDDINHAFIKDTGLSLSQTLLNIHSIFYEFMTQISAHGLSSMLTSELKLRKILSKCESRGLPIDGDIFHVMSEQAVLQFSEAQEKLNRLYNTTEFAFDPYNYDVTEVFSVFKKHKIPPSLSSGFFKADKRPELYEFALCLDMIHKYDKPRFTILDDRIHFTYVPYGQNGAIASDFSPDTQYLRSKDRVLVAAIFDNLFWRVFINYLNDKELISAVSEGLLMKTLANRAYGRSNATAVVLVESLLSGLIKGLNNPMELSKYVLSDYKTKLSEAEVIKTLKTFEEKIPRVISFIREFNDDHHYYKTCYKSRPARKPESPLAFCIRTTIDNIHKSALISVDEMLSDKSHSKYPIKLIGFFDGRIVLEAHQSASSNAIDILSNNISSSYSRYIKRLPIKFLVHSGQTLSGM